MQISRDLAIMILKYCSENRDFYFPFFIVCKEYSPEDDDYVELCPDEWKSIEEDEIYQTFELWENLQNLYEGTIELLAKGFIEKITNNSLENEIKILVKEYGKLYKQDFTESVKIEEYGTNEFFGGKKEAFEDVLVLINRYKI